jgi:hypothetical protein
MSRRTLYILLSLVFLAGVLWYASANVRVPEVSFTEAAREASANDDGKEKKVMVVGKVDAKKISVDGGEATFYMTDENGTESKISYSGSDPLTGGQLSKVAESGSRISIAGHSHGEYFHATEVFFPAY